MALTHYGTLGVPRDASRAEITAAFRAQMLALHGDAGGDDELAKHLSSAHNVMTHNTEVLLLWYFSRTTTADEGEAKRPGRL